MPTDPHLPYDSDQIFEYANLILAAAMPPVRGTGADVPLADRLHHIRERVAAHSYDDPSLSIEAGHASTPDGHPAHAIGIHLHDAPGQMCGTVFLAYEIYDSVTAALGDGRLYVQRFTPGPWCQHLEALALQAAAFLEARPPGQE
jgi:hypothetical protein